MRRFHKFEHAFLTLVLNRACHRQEIGVDGFLRWQFHDPISEPFLGGNFLLSSSCRSTDATALFDAEHLVIARHHLPGRAWLAAIEKNEVLDNVEQFVVREHARLSSTSASTRLPLSRSSRRFHSPK